MAHDNARYYRRQAGWIKIWRQVFQNPIWHECPQSWFRVWIAILGNANYEDRATVINGAKVIVPRGSLAIGSREFANFCGVTRQQLRTSLEYLLETHAITTKTTRHYTIVTVTNWDTYQGDDCTSNPPDNQPGVQSVTQSVTTLKEYKENPSSGGLFPDVNNAPFDPMAEQPQTDKRRGWREKYDSMIVEMADRLHDRHPAVRRCGPKEVAEKLNTILKRIPRKEWLAKLNEIDASHKSLCGTEQWTKDGGQFAKGLANWLAPSKERWEHSTGAQEAPKPKQYRPMCKTWEEMEAEQNGPRHVQ